MNVFAEKVIVEKAGPGWLVMWPDGNVNWYASKKVVIAACKARKGSRDVLVTTVEWR